MRPLLIAFVALTCAGCECAGKVEDLDASIPDAGSHDAGSTEDGGSTEDAGRIDAGEPSAARLHFETVVQPALASQCASCHLGVRFAFASFTRSGPAFTAADSARNYEVFFDQLSLDSPKKSRLIAKVLPVTHDDALTHAGGALIQEGDATYAAFLRWAELEKAERCPDCGPGAPTQFLAYVEAPALNWALAKDPIRIDHGLRARSKIVLQRIDPQTFKATGAPIDFLPPSFCGADGRCDFGNLAASHRGDRLAFECRLSLVAGKDWVNDVRWNLCIAEIGPDGKAVNPRFLLPPELRHEGDTISRSDPFALFTAQGAPLKGVYDMHFRYRRRDDKHPVFSPDDTRLYYSSKAPEPRGGDDGSTAYHGTDLRNHILSVRLDGTERRTIYLNEGGEADFPFFLRNGNVVFHTWNLDRMDRHLYTQATAEGMQELPVLFGRVQGPNMWGKAVQLSNGVLLGMTGNRRASVDNFVPFVADHTLGTGIDATLTPYALLDTAVFDQVLPFPNGYCVDPPEGSSCFVDRFYAEPSYSPDGRAFIAHNPVKTYVQQGEDLFLNYAGAPPLADQLARLANFVPTRMGIWLVDHHGKLERFVEPPIGKMLRSPEWVGPRAPERVQPPTVDETKTYADLHIADVPVWLSFRTPQGTVKRNLMQELDRVVALRVLVKDGKGTACINDARPYRFAVPGAGDDHPTALGINNATGFKRLVPPGGGAFGDVPLAADHSAFVRVPSNRLLLLQGIDAQGHVVVQHERLFALPPGVRVDTGVKRAQYRAQCSSCHGDVDVGQPFVGLAQVATLEAAPMDYATTAARAAPVDLSASTPEELSFKGALRPLLDAKCTSCHSGDAPGGELSLEATFSTTGNYPRGKWASGTLSDAAYRSFVPAGSRVPAYNYSMAYSWVFKEDEQEYRQSTQYAPKIASHAPLAELAPWDPAYQNLFANDGSRYVYLSGFLSPNFGRSDRLGGLSSDSWLVEILTGRDLDPVRNFTGATRHDALLTPREVRTVMAVIDVGFPYMTRCDDKQVSSGVNAGKPWGDPDVSP